jgi:16S rRNA (cytosine967-C5)-methyltransferase
MSATVRAAVAPARVCAYAVLRRVFERGAYADRALHAQARELDARDRALAMRLAYGAVQRRGTLDHLIVRLAERSLARLDPPVLAALRLGLYELLYLRGAPDHAVVADAVELAKGSARGGHGLVNAVLRRALREGPAGLLAVLDDRTPEDAAVMHSHPEWSWAPRPRVR